MAPGVSIGTKGTHLGYSRRRCRVRLIMSITTLTPTSQTTSTPSTTSTTSTTTSTTSGQTLTLTSRYTVPMMRSLRLVAA